MTQLSATNVQNTTTDKLDDGDDDTDNGRYNDETLKVNDDFITIKSIIMLMIDGDDDDGIRTLHQHRNQYQSKHLHQQMRS